MLMFYQDTLAVESALVSPVWTDRGHHWHEGFKSLIKGGGGGEYYKNASLCKIYICIRTNPSSGGCTHTLTNCYLLDTVYGLMTNQWN